MARKWWLLIAGIGTAWHPALAQPATDFDGQWRLQRQTDPIDDSGSMWLVIGSQREHLAIGCELGQAPEVVFQTRAYLGENRRGLLAGGRELAYRFDQAPAVSAFWSYESDRVMTDRASEFRAFVDGLRGSRTVYLRLTKFDGESANYRFNYPSPADLDQIVSACLPE